MLSPPDILVLGGGGVLGEAWMTGVLSGIESATGWDLRRCEYFVGTSAGSIVAAGLAAGERPRRPARAGRDQEPEHSPIAQSAARLSLPERAAAWGLALSSPLAPLSLSVAAPAGARARSLMLRLIGRGSASLEDLRRRVDASGARFDGRLRIVAVELRTGRRVVLGRPSAPRASVGQAVEASCAVPWLFAPVSIAGSEYVDGGVWSPTNLDAAPAGRGSYVLCLNPTAGLAGASTLSLLARGTSRSIAAVEAAALRSRGARVVTVGPDAKSMTAMGRNLMAYEPRARVLAAGYAQGLSLHHNPRLRLSSPVAASSSSGPDPDGNPASRGHV